MANGVTPFYREQPQVETARPGGWTLRLMRLHFTLVGVVLLVAALGLIWYLYSTEFRRVDVTWSLRLRDASEVYEPQVQVRAAVALAVAVAGFVLLWAAGALSRGGSRALGLGRVAATLLLAGFPLGVLLWRLELDIPGVPLDTAQLALRIVAVLFVLQAALAVIYLARLWSRELRRALEAGSLPADRAVHRVQTLGLALWLILVVGLGVALGVLTDWLYEVPVEPPQPGELLYATSFDALNDEWDTYRGRDSAQVLSGGDLAALAEDRAVLPPDDPLLVISYGSPITNENVFSALDRKFNDMDLRVTARQIAGPDDNQFGVVFRYKDLDNYYAFLISSDGYYSLVKRQGGTPEVISDWGATAVVRQGQVTNEIRIVALGDAFRFFINGEAMPLCLKGENALSMWDPSQPGQCYTGDLTYIYRDTDFAQGRIALTAGSSVDLSGDIVVGFDDLIIIGPDPDIITADVEAE